MNQVILSMKDINKSFQGVQALMSANLEVRKGEVHALMGENGAGKSTLMKILSGIYLKDAGVINYEGKEVDFRTPKEAQDAGIMIVHQELNMVNDLTVAQNIYIGREIMRGKFVDDQAISQATRELFERLNMEIDPNALMGDLTVGKQQMCEIAKAVSQNAKLIVFDEPTAALTETEIEELFVIINDLKKKGLGIVYISHRMDEIKAITDRVTVMRDGEYEGTLITKDSTKEEIISRMVGRVIYEEPKQKSNVPEDAETVLKVENLNAGKAVQNVSFELKKGEILGFAGLMGAGRTETARALFGADKKESGTIYVKGQEVIINSPEDAVSYGIGYLSEDRKRFGAVIEKSVAENTTMASLKNFCSRFFINEKKENEVALKYIKLLNTKTPDEKQKVANLSGGNQQKVVIAKWLARDCDILIFDEPTRGIDIGAKSEIYHLMNELAKEGKSIIMISSELTEVLRMSDRVIVMSEGKITEEFDIADANQEVILNAALKRK